ncbi:prepilin-type N-terminal cleavage/methylation domain-containing protein [Brevundimonas sp.]|uniref:prepilin-type N-terminal cleavage/methylation domain-containing protein n=1 Tax=Brevundimonas sp. TaxID=1871086 RepID=UPI002E121C66|nr:prepilin-type N-terminal cleavage/methylation domain-containing protein [Brevundimonas sp.]
MAQETRRRKTRSARQGFTLIEVIVALGLFSLIALAGFALLRAVLDAQTRTEARLERLSEIQRSLFVVTADLDQVSGRIEGMPDAITFQKTDPTGRPHLIGYGVQDGALIRTVAGPAGQRTQTVLRGVTSARWSYRLSGLGWGPISTLPVAADAGLEVPQPTVRAVALDLALTGPDGRPTEVRRVVAVPEIAP